jgi:hypothetical protein
MARVQTRNFFGRRRPLIIGVAAAVGLIAVIFGFSRLIAGGAPERAFRNLMAADRFHTEAELLLHLPAQLRGEERTFTEIRGTVAGDVQRAESGTPELAGTLYAEAKGRGTVFFADGDIRVLEDEVLFRLDDLPVFLNRSGSLVKRWTRVEAPLLNGNETSGDIRQALASAFGSLDRAGRETIDGERLVRFTGRLSGEEEDALVGLLRRGVSGSQGWNVLARLLSANNLDSFDVWIDPSDDEVRRIRLHFVRPLSDGRVFDFALLTLSFKDYGKEVSVDRPEAALVVQPRVFAKLFGEGTVENIE